MRYPNLSHGYTLLFSVLTATLVLGVAVFILGVSKKQLVLSVAARDSTFAIYAADGAMECAILASSNISSTTGGTIACNGEYSGSISEFETDISKFFPYPASMSTDDLRQGSVNVVLPEGTCAKVIFTAGRLDDLSQTPVRVIDARGYNYCSESSPSASNPRTVERALRFVQRNVEN